MFGGWGGGLAVAGDTGHKVAWQAWQVTWHGMAGMK